MPYVKQLIRDELDELVDDLSEKVTHLYKQAGCDRDGMMNYVITRLMLEVYPNPSYKTFNEIVGCLECCKLEFYRTQVAPYEDEKSKENGPVTTERSIV